MRDMKSNIAASLLILKGREKLTASGSGYADLAGYDAATILIGIGGTGSTVGAASNVKFYVYHSDTATSAGTAAVAAADIIGVTPTSGLVLSLATPTACAAAAGITRVGYVGGKRYIRIMYAASGAATGATGAETVKVMVSVVKGRPQLAPVS